MIGIDVRGAARQVLPPALGLALLFGAWSWLAASGFVPAMARGVPKRTMWEAPESSNKVSV